MESGIARFFSMSVVWAFLLPYDPELNLGKLAWNDR